MPVPPPALPAAPRPRPCPGPSGTVGRTALLALSLTLVAGCSAAPKVVPAPLATEPSCAEVTWPSTVLDLSRTATDPVVPSAAAWGDPAIIARCGLPAPGPTTDLCTTVNGVDWVVRELTDGTAATTYGREPAIEVLVPTEYGPVTMLLPTFAAAARDQPETGHHCS